MFQVQLTPAICAREAAKELNMIRGEVCWEANPAKGGPF